MRPAMSLKSILLGIAVILVSFFVSLKTMDWLAARRAVPPPAIAELPPLPPAARVSSIMVPVAISISAIRDVADRAAPRNFAGKAENPVSQVLQNADIGWTASRGPIQAAGAQDVLSLAMPLTGKLNVTGSLSSKATGAVGDVLSGLVGGNAAKQIGSINIKALNASAEIKGNVTFTSRPKFSQAWHLEPNLAAQVSLGDTSLIVAGARVNVPAQVKPVIEKNVAEQVAAAETRVRNDRTFEQSARAQWARACRSIPLQGTGAASSLPPRWLRSRASTPLRSQRRSESRWRRASLQRRPSRSVRFPEGSSSSRRWPEGCILACRSTCRLPTSARSWQRSWPAARFRRTVRVRSTSP